MLSLNYLSK